MTIDAWIHRSKRVSAPKFGQLTSTNERSLDINAKEHHEPLHRFTCTRRFDGCSICSNSFVIKYNHLVANILAFHNIVSMTKAIDRLKAEGQEISDEVLAAVSPYQTSHINRFGQYQLHARRVPDPLPFLRKPPHVELSTVDPRGLAAAG